MNTDKPYGHYCPVSEEAFEDGETDALYVGTGGTVHAVRADGTGVSFDNVPSGTILAIRCIGIGIGSTAHNIVALYHRKP